MASSNRPGDTGDGTDPNGVRRSRARLDRAPRPEVEARSDATGRPVRPRTRPVGGRGSETTLVVPDASDDLTMGDASLDLGDPTFADGFEPSFGGEATAALPVITPAIPDVAFAEAPVLDPVPGVLPAPDVPPAPRTTAGPVSSPAPKQRAVVSRRRRRPRVRRVRRVLRSVDTWTVFKVSLLFYLVAYVILLVAGVLLWNLAYATGTIENLQEFFTDFGWSSFEFDGQKIFTSSWIIGLFLVVAGTGLNVTLATVFNLIADLVGGIGVTVLEEEVRIVAAIPSGPESADLSEQGV